MKRYIAALLLVTFFSGSAVAQAAPITRRDGFLLMWQSLKRPAEPGTKQLFSDVSLAERGGQEITYAKRRSLLDDEDAFRPDDPLTLADAIVWLFRTRNIDDPDSITAATLTGYLLKYPIAHLETAEAGEGSVSEEDVLKLMRSFDAALVQEEHEVSLYAEKFHGKGTAFGESFDMHAMTAAHKYFPHNTLVKVTNVANGKSVIVRINDRGPYVDGRDMDLSLAAFTAISPREKGVIQATFQRLGDARLLNMCAPAPEQQRISRTVRLIKGVPHRLALGNTITLAAEKPFVVRRIRYPDGNAMQLQDFVLHGEEFQFKPSLEGEYEFKLGTVEGKNRTMTMRVVKCAD